jgi:hypothetical protein
VKMINRLVMNSANLHVFLLQALLWTVLLGADVLDARRLSGVLTRCGPLPKSFGKGKCEPGCTKGGHGVCNWELGRCDCPRGWVGEDCSQPPEDLEDICKCYSFNKPYMVCL